MEVGKKSERRTHSVHCLFFDHSSRGRRLLVTCLSRLVAERGLGFAMEPEQRTKADRKQWQERKA